MINEIRQELLGSYTPEGVERWLDRSRILLGGKTPRELLESNDQEKIKKVFKLVQNINV